MSIEQGGIFGFDFGPRSNNLIEGPHSVVVVQTNDLNRLDAYQNVIVVPITSKPRKSPTYVLIKPSNANQLTIDSYAITNQIFTVDKGQLGLPKGKATKYELAQIKQGLAITLDIRKDDVY